MGKGNIIMTILKLSKILCITFLLHTLCRGSDYQACQENSLRGSLNSTQYDEQKKYALKALADYLTNEGWYNNAVTGNETLVSGALLGQYSVSEIKLMRFFGFAAYNIDKPLDNVTRLNEIKRLEGIYKKSVDNNDQNKEKPYNIILKNTIAFLSKDQATYAKAFLKNQIEKNTKFMARVGCLFGYPKNGTNSLDLQLTYDGLLTQFRVTCKNNVCRVSGKLEKIKPNNSTTRALTTETMFLNQQNLEKYRDYNKQFEQKISNYYVEHNNYAYPITVSYIKKANTNGRIACNEKKFLSDVETDALKDYKQKVNPYYEKDDSNRAYPPYWYLAEYCYNYSYIIPTEKSYFAFSTKVTLTPIMLEVSDHNHHDIILVLHFFDGGVAREYKTIPYGKMVPVPVAKK
jgi:hypothetical protein